MTYVSSITTKYGDVERVKEDVKALKDIFRRQGASLLIDVIADSIGQSVIDFKLNEANVKTIKESIVNELVESIEERT